MKTSRTLSIFGKALSGLIAAGFTCNVHALDLRYLEAGFGHNVGDAFTGGGLSIKIQDWDAGTTYTNGAAQLAVGTTRGFGEDGSGTQTVLGGVQELNSLAGVTTVQAVGARELGLFGVGAARLEDTWGIAKVTTISDSNGLIIWQSGPTQTELTALFYGEQDTYFKQTANDTITTSGVGLRIDLWEQSLIGIPLGQTFNASGGPTVPRGASGLEYLSVTEGTKLFTLQSAPGFLHQDGVLGGLAAEFETKFNISGGKGGGDAYMNVIAGSGTEATRFDTNNVSSNVSAPGLFADFAISFTTDSRTLAQGNSTNKFDWLVTSDDPIKAFIGSPVPEPATGLAGLACLIPALGRRRKAEKRA